MIPVSVNGHFATAVEPAMKTVRIGAGAGYSGDRIEPAVDLAARGNLDYLVFEVT
jgi:Acyclic terpene utilisation family protein AtuA